jgi:hypothetical protein
MGMKIYRAALKEAALTRHSNSIYSALNCKKTSLLLLADAGGEEPAALPLPDAQFLQCDSGHRRASAGDDAAFPSELDEAEGALAVGR